MPTAKNLPYRIAADCGILEFSGEVRGIGPREVRDLIEDIRRKQCAVIVFDLRAVTAISTAGWGMIFSARNRLEDAGAALVIVGDAEHLRHQSAHGPLDRFIPVCESLGKARIAGQRILYELRKADRDQKAGTENR